MEEHVHNHTHSADVHTEHCDCGCGADHGAHFEENKKAERSRIILAAVFFALGWVFDELTALPDYIFLICYLVSYVAVGFGVVREALEHMLKRNIFTEYFLISVASVGALAIGEYGEGCAVMLLYAVGEFVQDMALSKSQEKMAALAAARGFEHSHANSDTERFISKFAKIYTPIICALAVLIIAVPPLFLGGAWKEWVHRGLSALVIGCPCAIVISVPLAFSCAIGACTRKGIFVHCSDALERLYKNQSEDAGEITVTDGAPDGLAFAKRAAKKAMLIARENIAFTLAVKAAVLILAVFLNRELPMWLAEFSDVGVAILAILNSLRALRVK